MGARRMWAWLAVLPLSFGLVGCGPAGEDASAEGIWGETGEGMPQLVLAEDGALSGTDGCNNLVGSWQQSGATVEFGPVGSTMMFCEGVDTWLSGANTGEVSGKQMAIFNAEGQEIGSLTKQD